MKISIQPSFARAVELMMPLLLAKLILFKFILHLRSCHYCHCFYQIQIK